MGFARFIFSKLWTNPEHFPTVETDETQVRADMQELHNQSKDGLNNLMTALEDQSAAGNLGARVAGGTEKSTVQAQLDALRNAITASSSVPGGGAAGQALTKASGADFDCQWSDLAPAIHASSHAAGGSDPITPASIGALPETGGKMTGNLTITGDGPYVIVKDNTSGRSCQFTGYDNGFLAIVNMLDGNDYQALQLAPETEDRNIALRILRLVNGVSSTCNIFHEGNFAALGGVRVQKGLYTGTGTCGPDSPSQLSFDFVPEMMVIAGSDGDYGLILPKVSLGRMECADWYSPLVSVSVAGTTVSWHASAGVDASYQLNTDGVTYHYVAFG